MIGPLFALAIIIVVILLVMYFYPGAKEHYRMYFGSGVQPLSGACASPYCGGDPGTFDEDSMYPFLLLNTSSASNGFTTDNEQLTKILGDIRQNTSETTHITGMDMQQNYTVEPNNDLEIDVKKMMDDIAKKQVNTSQGMQKAEQGEFFSPGQMRYDMGPYDGQIPGIDTRDSDMTGDEDFRAEQSGNYTEGFMQAPSYRTYTALGNIVNEHPDMDDFNKMYYSNSGRTIGITDQQQAVTHFNESTAYYGNVQTSLPASVDAYRWNDRNVPQMNASDYFDVSDKYSSVIDDPREPITGTVYDPLHGPVYKKRMHFVDLMDEMNRKRNNVLIESAERGTRISNTSRDIMNTVFGSDMEKDQRQWWWNEYER